MTGVLFVVSIPNEHALLSGRKEEEEALLSILQAASDKYKQEAKGQQATEKEKSQSEESLPGTPDKALSGSGEESECSEGQKKKPPSFLELRIGDFIRTVPKVASGSANNGSNASNGSSSSNSNSFEKHGLLPGGHSVSSAGSELGAAESPAVPNRRSPNLEVLNKQLSSLRMTPVDSPTHLDSPLAARQSKSWGQSGTGRAFPPPRSSVSEPSGATSAKNEGYTSLTDDDRASTSLADPSSSSVFSSSSSSSPSSSSSSSPVSSSLCTSSSETSFGTLPAAHSEHMSVSTSKIVGGNSLRGQVVATPFVSTSHTASISSDFTKSSTTLNSRAPTREGDESSSEEMEREVDLEIESVIRQECSDGGDASARSGGLEKVQEEECEDEGGAEGKKPNQGAGGRAGSGSSSLASPTHSSSSAAGSDGGGGGGSEFRGPEVVLPGSSSPGLLRSLSKKGERNVSFLSTLPAKESFIITRPSSSGQAGTVDRVLDVRGLLQKTLEPFMQEVVFFPDSTGNRSLLIFTADRRSERILLRLQEIGVGRDYGSIGILPLNIAVPSPEPARAGSVDAKFSKSIRSRMIVQQVMEQVKLQAEFSFDFLLLTVVASTLAGFGLMLDNAVVIVASMLVSPIMGPVLGLCLGSVVNDWRLVRLSFVNELRALLLCVVVGFVLGLGFVAFNESIELPTGEMSSRGEALGLVYGVCIAIPSGVGVALSVLGNNTNSLVGVAISASLLPPAVNTGLLFAYVLFAQTLGPQGGEREQVDTDQLLALGLNSFLLTLLNIVCIYFAAVCMFKIKEVAPIPGKTDLWKEFIPEVRRQHNLRGAELLEVEQLFRESWEDPESAHAAAAAAVARNLATVGAGVGGAAALAAAAAAIADGQHALHPHAHGHAHPHLQPAYSAYNTVSSIGDLLSAQRLSGGSILWGEAENWRISPTGHRSNNYNNSNSNNNNHHSDSHNSMNGGGSGARGTRRRRKSGLGSMAGASVTSDGGVGASISPGQSPGSVSVVVEKPGGGDARLKGAPMPGSSSLLEMFRPPSPNKFRREQSGHRRL